MTDRAELPARLRANAIGYTSVGVHDTAALLNEAADALSAIASRQAVKPLVWRPKENYSIAETPFGEYTVTRYEESDGIGWEAVYQDAEVIGTFPTEADARNACDALHAKRINSALAAPVRGETEIRAAALEEAAKWHDQRAHDTPDAFETEFHHVSASAIRALSQTSKPEEPEAEENTWGKDHYDRSFGRTDR